MISRRWSLVSLALVLMAVAGCGSDVRIGVGGAGYFNSYIGTTPPALAPGTWINSAELTLDGLKGKVVWLEFSFLH